nr:MAG TPA: hypothetical protein [Caudoviricetes sp.]
MGCYVCDGKARLSDARAWHSFERQSSATQRRSKARIGNGVVTRALLRQARAKMCIDRHGKGNVKLSNA